MRGLLDELEAEVIRTIKDIDFPPYFWEKYIYNSVADGLRKRMGVLCWDKNSLPRDVNGNKVYRG